MFSTWGVILLKFYDFCGFHTGVINNKSHACRLNSSRTFLIHVAWTFTLTCFVLMFSMQPILNQEAMPYLVNLLLQLFNGIITHWMIIVESYAQRKVQQKFWQIYEHIKQHHKHCKRPMLRLYSLNLIHFFVVVVLIQIFFLSYHMDYVVNKWYFRLSYLTSQTTYQYRVFYYIFYLELIKYELKLIKVELKDIATLTNFHSKFIRRTNQRTKRHPYRRSSWSDSTVKSVNEKNLKRINAYCQLVYELSECMNQTFGWSNFTTILYCFHFPLTDGNWALWELDQRPIDYIIG